MDSTVARSRNPWDHLKSAYNWNIDSLFVRNPLSTEKPKHVDYIAGSEGFF